MRRSATVLAFSMFLGLFASPGVHALTEEQVSKQLKCQCGCGYPDLASCSCGEWAIPAKNEIRARISRGEDLQTILKYFVDRHGETVLTTPIQEGFNRAEWIVPSVLILVAGGLLSVALYRWKRRDETPKPEAESKADEDAPVDGAMLERLHEEIYGPKED